MPAWDAVLASGRVITIDDGFKAISGFSAEDGRWLWRAVLDGEPRGTHSLVFRGGSVVFWRGNQVQKIDPVTGSLAAPVEADWNGDCRFVEQGSACAYECSCHLSLADCATGARIGERYEKTHISFHHVEGESSAGCFGMSTGLVTGAGGITIITAEDGKPRKPNFDRETIALGLDAKTGKELWRSSEVALIGFPRVGGGSRDGRTCWIADDEGELRVFACASGKALWKKPGWKREKEQYAKPFVSYVAERDAVFRFIGAEAALFDLRSGRELWKKVMPSRGAAVPLGAPLGILGLVANEDKPLLLHLLQPSDGAVMAQVAMPGDSRLHNDPGGGYYLHSFGGELVAYDASGRQRWRSSPPGGPLFRGDFFSMTDFDTGRLTIFDRSDAESLGEIRGSFGVQPGSSLRNGILLLRVVDRGQSIGQAIFVRPPAR